MDFQCSKSSRDFEKFLIIKYSILIPLLSLIINNNLISFIESVYKKYGILDIKTMRKIHIFDKNLVVNI